MTGNDSWDKPLGIGDAQLCWGNAPKRSGGLALLKAREG